MGEGEGDDEDEDDEIDEEEKDEENNEDDEEEKDDEDDEEEKDVEEEGGAGSGEISSQCTWRVWLFGVQTIDVFVTLSFFSLNHPENVKPVLSGIGRSP